MTEEDRLRARVAELEQRLGDIPPPGVPGKRVMLFFGGMFVVAFAAALSLWGLAKRTAAVRNARVAAPTMSRVDAAGHAMARAVAECVGERSPASPITVRARVKLTPAGTLGILDASSEPPDAEIIPCVRRSPANVHVPAGEDGAGDVEITYAIGTAEGGERFTRTTWALRPPTR